MSCPYWLLSYFLSPNCSLSFFLSLQRIQETQRHLYVWREESPTVQYVFYSNPALMLCLKAFRAKRFYAWIGQCHCLLSFIVLFIVWGIKNDQRRKKSIQSEFVSFSWRSLLHLLWQTFFCFWPFCWLWASTFWYDHTLSLTTVRL